MVAGSRPRASQLAKYFSAAAASVIPPALSGEMSELCAEPFTFNRLYSSSASRCLRLRCASRASGPRIDPRAVVAHVVAAFGMFFDKPFFCVHKNHVGLDLGVVVVRGFAIPPCAVDLDVLV